MKNSTKFLIVGSLMVVLIILMIYLERDKGFELNGVKLSNSEYNQLKENYKDYVNFKVCNIENKQCVLFTNFENYEEKIEQNGRE